MITMERAKKHAPEALLALCCLVYFASYVTRLDYAAVLVEIVRDLQLSNTTAGIAVTGSFITYGLGMILFGFTGYAVVYHVPVGRADNRHLRYAEILVQAIERC